MNKELEKAKKIFGKDIDIKNEEVVKKAYRKLVKKYSENVEDEEKFKEVNLARDAIIKYLNIYKTDSKKLTILYERKDIELRSEKNFLEEYEMKIKTLQKVINTTKNNSNWLNIYKKIPIPLIFIVVIITFIILFKYPESMFIWIIGYTFFFNFLIKASKQKQNLSAFYRERHSLRKKKEYTEKRIQTLTIELYAVKIALDSINEEKEERKCIECIEKNKKDSA